MVFLKSYHEVPNRVNNVKLLTSFCIPGREVVRISADITIASS